MARIREDVVRDMVLSYGGAANVVRFAADGIQAADVAAELGRPLAIKLVADDVVHKSKAGGVMLGIAPENAAEATEELLARHRANGSAVRGVTIEAMVDPGVPASAGHSPSGSPIGSRTWCARSSPSAARIGMLQREDVTEVDLNPIVVSPDRVVTVDARASELDQPRTARQLPDPAASFDELRPAIYPESIAVVGASADPTKMAIAR